MWFIYMYREMELRYWLVHGNVKNSRINYLNEKRLLIPRGLSADLKNKSVLEFCGFPCSLDVEKGRRLPYVL